MLSFCYADQKQVENKNLDIFFVGDVTICMYSLRLCHFLSQILSIPFSTTPVTTFSSGFLSIHFCKLSDVFQNKGYFEENMTLWQF